MSLYSKIDLISFADYYHRFAITGLTFEEIFMNWEKYRDKPRDANDAILLPKQMQTKIEAIKPPASKMMEVVAAAAKVNYVHKEGCLGKNKSNKTRFVKARQQIAYVGLKLHFEAPDFESILGWQRSSVYHRTRACNQYAKQEINFRKDLNVLLELFGLELFNP